MLNIFEFSRVWENVESWLVSAKKLFWILQPYFSTNVIQVSASFFFLFLGLLTVIISLYLNKTKKIKLSY